jgi:hypothetical protein
LTDKPVEAASGTIEYNYWIVATAEPEKMGYRRVTELLWQKFGGPGLRQAVDLQRNVRRPELLLFDDWRKEAWSRYANEKYFEFECGDKRCGALTSNREIALRNKEPKQDAWFNSWFQNLRTAYGWYLYARRANDSEMKRKAEQVLNLVLQSPRQNGAFSTIYLHDTNTWFRDDGWAGYVNDYHTFCMSWTAYWMLRWANDLVPERKPEILAFAGPYADFLLRVQQPSGNIPSWIGEDSQPRQEFRDFNAETAGSALFLAEFFASTGDKKYLDGALRAEEFITREVLSARALVRFRDVPVVCAKAIRLLRSLDYAISAEQSLDHAGGLGVLAVVSSNRAGGSARDRAAGCRLFVAHAAGLEPPPLHAEAARRNDHAEHRCRMERRAPVLRSRPAARLLSSHRARGLPGTRGGRRSRRIRGGAVGELGAYRVRG